MSHIITQSPTPGFSKCMSHIFYTRNFQMYVTQSHIRLTQNSFKTSTTGFSKMCVTHHTISSTRIFQMYATHFHNLGFSKMYVTHHHWIFNTRIFQMYVPHFLHQEFPNVCHTISYKTYIRLIWDFYNRIFQSVCHTSHNLIHQDFPNVCHTFS